METPIIKIENNKLSVTNFDPTVTNYSWQYSKTLHGYDEWLGFGTEMDIKPRFQIDGHYFFCYARDNTTDGRTPDSKRVIYKSGAPAPICGCTDSEATNYNPNATEDDGTCIYSNPTNNDKVVLEMRAHLLTATNALTAIEDLFDDIE